MDYALTAIASAIAVIVLYKLWLAYKPSAEAAAYKDGVKLVQRLARLNAPQSAAEVANAAAAQAHLDAMKAAFKAEVDKLLA